MLKVNHHTERGTETRRYLPERHEAAWNEREYAVGKIAELEAENAKLRELVEYMHRCFVRGHDWGRYCAGETVWVEQRMRELGVEV